MPGGPLPDPTFEAILQELLDRTGATRTTLRLDLPDLGFQINDVAAEALAPGMRSLRCDTSIDQRAAASARFLERERRMLVQPDCLNAEAAPPPELIRLYGVRAQMLGPVIRSGELTGWISVHDTRDAREWRAADIAALEEAIARVVCLLV